MAFEKKRAKRTAQRARIALSGPSGSGKTMTALLLAKGLVEAEAPERVRPDVSDDEIAIVVLDTEHRSSELYDEAVPFAAYHLDAPYSPERYCEALDEIERANPLVVIVDQGSHAWAGKGGLMETLDKIKKAAKGGNDFTAWGEITPKQTSFVERLLEVRCHLIVTLRSKAEYVLEEKTNRKGNKVTVPRKIGMAPIQRDGFEYEFMTMFELDRDTHEATVSKDRTSIFPDGDSFLLDAAWGQKLHAWLSSAPPPEIKTPDLPESKDEPKKKSNGQRGKTADTLLQGIGALFAEHGLGSKEDPAVLEEKYSLLRKAFGTSNPAEVCELTVELLRDGKSRLEGLLVQRTQPGDESVPFGEEHDVHPHDRMDAEK